VNIILALGTRTTRMQTIADHLDANGAGQIRFYDGVMPAGGGAAGLLISAQQLSIPSGSVVAGQLTLSPIAPNLNIGTVGVIAWARLVNGAGEFVMDLDCGIAGDGAAITLSTLEATIGGAIQILSAVIIDGNA